MFNCNFYHLLFCKFYDLIFFHKFYHYIFIILQILPPKLFFPNFSIQFLIFQEFYHQFFLFIFVHYHIGNKMIFFFNYYKWDGSVQLKRSSDPSGHYKKPRHSKTDKETIKPVTDKETIKPVQCWTKSFQLLKILYNIKKYKFNY